MIVDLSHSIENGMVTYKGLPEPVITEHLTREASRALYTGGTEFSIGRINMVANTGTYVDAPFHRHANGADLAELPLEALADLAGLMAHPTKRRIEPADLPIERVRGRALLIHTGWDRHWRTERYWSGDHPFITRNSAEALAEAGALFVGIDSYNIDDTADGSRPAHTLLLAAGIPICEHMTNLGALPGAGFRLFAVPPKVHKVGSFPVRAFAIVPVTL